MPRTPSPSKKNDGLESDEKEGYSSDYETKEENSTDKGEYNTSMDTATRRSQETPTCAARKYFVVDLLMYYIHKCSVSIACLGRFWNSVAYFDLIVLKCKI